MLEGGGNGKPCSDLLGVAVSAFHNGNLPKINNLLNTFKTLNWTP